MVDKKLFLASDFLKIWSFLFYVVYIHIIKGLCHSYQDNAQTSVCTSSVAMETPTNNVKMTFFISCYIFLLFLVLLIRISIPRHTRTKPNFWFTLSHIYSCFMKSCLTVKSFPNFEAKYWPYQPWSFNAPAIQKDFQPKVEHVAINAVSDWKAFITVLKSICKNGGEHQAE